MVTESWLNTASDLKNRGRVFAAYTMINLTVVTAGMQLLILGSPMSFELFSLTAILYSLAAVPIALTRTVAPAPPRRARLRLGWLFMVSPAAVLGLPVRRPRQQRVLDAVAALWTDRGPLRRRHRAVHDGGRAGRRREPMAGRAAVRSHRPARGVGLRRRGRGGGGDRAVFHAVRARQRAGRLSALRALYGAMAFPVYALCVAHANDLVHRKRAVEVSSGLLMTYSIGAVLGPLLASLLMAEGGNRALFLHTALAHTLHRRDHGRAAAAAAEAAADLQRGLRGRAAHDAGRLRPRSQDQRLEARGGAGNGEGAGLTPASAPPASRRSCARCLLYQPSFRAHVEQRCSARNSVCFRQDVTGWFQRPPTAMPIATS